MSNQVNLSELYDWLSGYNVSPEFGFVSNKDFQDRICLSNLSYYQIVGYFLFQKFGPYLSVQILNDIPESDTRRLKKGNQTSDTEQSATQTNGQPDWLDVEALEKDIKRLGEYGIFMNISESQDTESTYLMILSGIDTNKGSAEIVNEIAVKVTKLLKDLASTSGKAAVDWPRYLYVGPFSDYIKYNEVNELLQNYGTVLSYYSPEGYNLASDQINTKNQQLQFKHIKSKYTEDEQYNFTDQDACIQQLSSFKRLEDGSIGRTDIGSLRGINIVYSSMATFYNDLVGGRDADGNCIDTTGKFKYSNKKVFSLSSSACSLIPDPAFYVVLALAQMNYGIKVLIPNYTTYNEIVADLSNLPFADLNSRYHNFRELYESNRLRLFRETSGVFTFGVVRDSALNFSFCGINKIALSKLIQLNGAGEFSIALDLMCTDSSNLDIMTQHNFNTMNGSPDIKLASLDAMQLLIQTVLLTCPKAESENAEVADNAQPNKELLQRIEAYAYQVCRLFDQILTGYKRFTTVRDLAAFRVISADGKTSDYIGIGSMDPEVSGDKVILSEEGIIVTDNKFSGKMIGIENIDDLELIKVGKSTDSQSWYKPLPSKNNQDGSEVDEGGIKELTVVEKIAEIYANANRELNPEVLNLEKGKLSKRKDAILLQCILYGAGISSDITIQQSTQNLVRAIKGTPLVDCQGIKDLMIPVYIGLTSSMNYNSSRYMLERVLELTNSYGYRRVGPKNSPLNIYGGLNRNSGCNIELQPQLFQRHRKEPVE